MFSDELPTERERRRERVINGLKCHWEQFGQREKMEKVGDKSCREFELFPLYWASLVAQMVKNVPWVQESWAPSLGWEDPLEKEMEPTSVFLPGEFHGQRRLVGYSAWSHKELDMTEQLTFSLSTILCIHLLCLLMWGVDYKIIHPLCIHRL